MRIPINIQNKLSGRTWYHQRFDGCPLFLYFIAESELKKEERKPKGTEADIRVCFFSQGKADWYLNMSDIRRGADMMVRLARRDSKISQKLISRWRKDEQIFEAFFYKIFPKINVVKLSDEKLVSLWDKYYWLSIRRLTSSSIIDHFALGTDELIHNMIKKEIGKVSRFSEFTEIFSALTAPVHQSFINQAQIDLLKIATKVSKESLQDYQKRYFWTKTNYYKAEVLTEKYFRKELQTWKRSGRDFSDELRHIQNTPYRNKAKKEKLLRKYHFSKLLKTLLKISENFTWWQDERKKSTYLYVHTGCQIIKEMAKRTGYAMDELKYALPQEIEKVFTPSFPSRKELSQRADGCMFIVTREGFWLAFGQDVIKVKKLMFGNKKVDSTNDIRGLSASLGKVMGKVKVVKSATEISKVEKGDILVAVMTRPDYITAMKKAAAIVTDEGGITSHAAIVSRELRIPCIIGTKIATSIFKDGDRVEVNANHGWVRKV